MGSGRLVAVAALGAALAGCNAVSVLTPPRETEPEEFSQETALKSVNAFRAANGLGALTTEPRLVEAAEAQSKAMAAKADMDHYVDGPLPQRIKRYGYQFSTAAENIAMGQKDFDEAMVGWEKSAGHRRNLLDPKMTEAGFAAAKDKTTGRIYWTQIFGRPRVGSLDALVAADGSPVMRFGGLQIR
ncbi:CAP domain-containing protein [Aureimonas leprariae]|nr:CAP domain-containing protein [Aureimonas leprariae]